jgi:hypothetical protein
LITVTNHAEKRFKERLGLPKSACQKHAQIAYDEGFKHEDARGKAKRYLDKLFLEHRNANAMRVYGEFVYLFTGETLITVLNLPKSVRGGFKHKSLSAA